MQQTPFWSPKLMAGATLVGLGLFILSGNLDGAAAQLSHLLGTTPGEALGVLPPAILTAAHALQAYAFDRRRFLRGLFQMLASFWPLLLVIVGALWLWDAPTNKSQSSPTT